MLIFGHFETSHVPAVVATAETLYPLTVFDDLNVILLITF